MATAPELHFREWGEGPPVLALHGLGLESSSFTGLGDEVVRRGYRMLAVDLPGFGLSPAPGRGLSPPVMAGPVIELARGLDTPPIVSGMSLGGRVALEAALLAPEVFRGVVMIAPPLPFRTQRWMLPAARLLSPEIAQRIPVDLAWPCLKRLADGLEEGLTGDAQHDWVLRASRRAIYYVSCPATRWALVSATRELALDPAYGSEGLWTRLPELSLPAAFVWGDKDKFVSLDNVPLLEEILPRAFQFRVPCAGHYNNGRHFRCLQTAAADAIERVDGVAQGARRAATTRSRTRLVACCARDDGPEPGGTTSSADLPPAPPLELCGSEA